MHAKRTSSVATSRAQPECSATGSKCLLVLAVKEVVGSVRHEHLFAHIGGNEATVVGCRSALVFKRWMKLVLLSSVPPVGPSFAPTVSSNRQAIEPLFGQLARVGAGGDHISMRTAAHTLLLSNELCHVALPKGTGCVGSWGFHSG